MPSIANKITCPYCGACRENRYIARVCTACGDAGRR